MCPKWINIKRGMVMCILLGGWALCPWIIIKSGKTFLSFMGAYAIFMAPIAGILCCDYWIIKRRKYDVPALFDPKGIYYYRVCIFRPVKLAVAVTDYFHVQLGTNWRALLCNLVVIVPLLPGLAHAVTPDDVSINTGLQHLYAINYLYGFSLSFGLYFVLNYIWPNRETLVPAVVPGVVHPLNAVDSDLEADLSTGDLKQSSASPKM
jgi:NCS1 family nucleobase:cation symporter-1